MSKNRRKRITWLVGILAVIIIGFFAVMRMTIWADTDKSVKKQTIEPEYIPDQIVVKFNKPLTDAEVSDKILKNTNKPPKKISRPLKENKEFSNFYVLNLDTSELLEPGNDPKLKNAIKANGHKEKIDSVLLAFKADPDVSYVEQDLKLTTQAVPNDTYFNSSGAWGQQYNDLWGLHKIQSQGAWDSTTGSGNTIVAVIDSGVDYNHPDLSANILKDSGGHVVGYDFANNDSDPMDDYGHGTHVAGIIGAQANNNLGVVGGIWNVKIMPIKITDFFGNIAESNAVAATVWAADHGAKIINDSWSGAGQSQALLDAVNYSHSLGVATIVSAGNYNTDVSGYVPASYENVITVSAYDNYDKKASFSNYGKIDVAAPGVSILSASAVPATCTTYGTPVGSNYCVYSGTSASAPFVSALAALIWDKNPTFSNEEIRQAIRTGADDVDSAGYDTRSGYGRINAAKALQMQNFLEGNISQLLQDQPDTHIYSIYGTAKGNGFSSYSLSYSATLDGTGWATFATGTSQVTDGLLGRINLASVPLLDRYYIKLSVKNSSGASFEDVGGPIYSAGIKGKVTNVVTGQALSGITINVLRENTTLVTSTITASDGTYELRDALPEAYVTYWIKTSNSNYVTRSTTLYRTGPSEGINNIDFPLTAITDAGTITGKVVNAATGSSIQATFTIYDSCVGPGYSFTTSADGTFNRQNQCVNTSFSMSNNTSGYRSEYRSIILTPMQSAVFDFYLVPSTSTAGSIRAQIWTSSAKTTHVDSGNITAFQSSTIKKINNFHSGGTGILSPIITGTYSVTVDAPGYQSQTKTGVVVTANTDTYLDFIMVSGGGGRSR